MEVDLEIQTIGDLIGYLEAFDPSKLAACHVIDTAQTLIVVDSRGNASVHKIDRQRTLMVMIELPVTDA